MKTMSTTPTNTTTPWRRGRESRYWRRELNWLTEYLDQLERFGTQWIEWHADLVHDPRCQRYGLAAAVLPAVEAVEHAIERAAGAQEAIETAIRAGIRPPARGREYRRRNLARNAAHKQLWWALWAYCDVLLTWRLRVASLRGKWPKDSQGRALPLASLGPCERIPGWLTGQRRADFCAMRNAFLEMEDLQRRYRSFRKDMLDGYEGPRQEQAASLRAELDLHLVKMEQILEAWFRILAAWCDADVPDEAVGAHTRSEDWRAIEDFGKACEPIGRRLDEWKGRWFYE